MCVRVLVFKWMEPNVNLIHIHVMYAIRYYVLLYILRHANYNLYIYIYVCTMYTVHVLYNVLRNMYSVMLMRHKTVLTLLRYEWKNKLNIQHNGFALLLPVYYKIQIQIKIKNKMNTLVVLLWEGKVSWLSIVYSIYMICITMDNSVWRSVL